MIANNTAYLCGYFSASDVVSLPAGWMPVNAHSDQEALVKKYYLPEFVDFWFKEVSCYTKEVGKDVTVSLRNGKTCSFRTEELRLYKMPQGQVLSTVKLVFTQVELDLVTESLASLRDCCYNAREGLGSFLSDVMQPLDEAFRSLTGTQEPNGEDYSHLVENGNKFKLFQIIHSEECPSDVEKRNRLLYDAGTLFPYVPEGPSSADKCYFDRIMKDARIGVFSSWTALALLDTVTFVSEPLPPYLVHIIQEDYFGMIYLYELYRKCVLYHYNVLFRERKRSPAILQKELDEFERRYVFPSLSYNFLPAEVDRHIADGLDIEKEDAQLNRFLVQEVAAREEEAGSRRERFLLFLTILAGFSAFWDILCLFDELFNFGAVFKVSNTGYRVFAFILFFVIALIALLIIRGNRSKK